MLSTIQHIKEDLKDYYPETEIQGLMRLIMEHVTNLSIPLIYSDKSRKITPTQAISVNKILDRLKRFEPIQYIIGETEFYGLPFNVDKSTLIPRPETEELVDLIVTSNKENSISILDIGTGSGCIAISLKKYIKNAEVTAWDISNDALDIARKNADRNHVDINFQQIDVLSKLDLDLKFDIIVSNPPYVLDSEKLEMEKNVLEYEPHSALFVPDNDALLFYKRIADIASTTLCPQGKLYFEINRSKGQETIDMLQQKGFKNISLIKDISGNDRIVVAELITT